MIAGSAARPSAALKPSIAVARRNAAQAAERKREGDEVIGVGWRIFSRVKSPRMGGISLPLDSGRRLGTDVEDHTAHAADFVGDAARYFLQQVMRQLGP